MRLLLVFILLLATMAPVSAETGSGETVTLLVRTEGSTQVTGSSADTVLGWREVSVPAESVDAFKASYEAAGAEVSESIRYQLTGPEDEPRFDEQWYFDNTGQTGGTPGADLGIEEAWESNTGQEVVVAVVDSGIDLGHPDLAGQFVPGWDYYDEDASPHSESEQHGSAVAGLVVAAVNGSGIAGSAPSAKVMPLRACIQVFDPMVDGCPTEDVMEAVVHAVDNGADVINLSLGAPVNEDPALESAMDYAEAAGVLVVAAAGNDGDNIDQAGNKVLPAGFPHPNILSVAWSTHTDSLDHESNYGPVSVDVAAPGGTSTGSFDEALLVVLAGGNGHAFGSGTSFSAPLVSGTAALLIAQKPTLTGVEVKDLIVDNVDSVGSLAGKVVTGGRVDAGKAMADLLAGSGTFIDDDDSVFEADIEWFAAQGITQGCNPPLNNKYCPEDPVTREVMAVYLARALNLPAATKDYFIDDANSQFEADINRAAEAGITKGCNPPANNLFCPKDVVDRGQLAAFFQRAYGLTDNGGGDLFVDDNNSIFENDIDRLATAGITKGCNPPINDMYCPLLPLDRGAVAAFFHRADGL